MLPEIPIAAVATTPARRAPGTGLKDERLAALNDFATSLSSLQTEDDILWELTRRCITTLGFEDCVIYLVDETRGVLVQKAAFGPKNPRGREIASPIAIPIGKGIVGSVAATGRTEIVADTRLDPRYLVDDQVRLSEISVPIIAEGKVLGVIDSEHSQAGFFCEDHITILGSIASICANKLARTRTEARLRELNQDLERRIAERTTELVAANERLQSEVTERIRAEKIQRALFEISEAAHAAEDLPRLYERIHQIIGTLMPAQNFYIALLNDESGEVIFPYHRDAIDPPPPPRKGRRGMTEYVLRTGRASLANLREIQRLKDSGEYVQSGHPSAIWLGAPLTVGGRTFGVIAVQDHHDDKAFGEEEKRILSFVAGQTAVTIERKRSEAEIRARTERLRESEERFSKAFRAIPATISLARATDGRLIEVNEAFLRNSDYSRAEVLGRTTSELGIWVDPRRREEFLCRLKSEGFVHGFEATLRTKTGRHEIVLISAELIEIDREPVILALALAITERKRAEEEMLRSLARERELSRMKSAFVSLVSHEFRTPLGVIHSSAEILERYLDRLPSAERDEHLQAIQSHAWRMASLLEEVLVFGRVEAGKLECRPAAFDLAESCRRWTQEMMRATESRCPIQLTIDPLPGTATGDPDLVRHIVTNLLSNAVKYSTAGEPVEFDVGHQQRFATLRIRDRGLGIPEAERPRLFNAFHRASNVRHLPGSGLGLVVIKHCVDLQAGSIHVDSTEGVGTTVTVHLPMFSTLSASPP
ncbi:MAG: GAF domain-containing protein [Verrucomicrobiales bacterium]|nr:GAF domain-containing protein [Verrucomicrobiales bacterium]